MRGQKAGSVRPIVIIGRVGIVTLTRGFYAVIDAADARIVGQRNWTVSMERRVGGSTPARAFVQRHGRPLSMHRMLTEATPETPIDHRNRNPLDNRRSNLRACDTSQNNENKNLLARNTSGAVGVRLDERGRWRAEVWHRGGRWIRYFRSRDEAIAARDIKARELHGEFAVLNNPHPQRQEVA